jgi:hypothetical protein
VFRGAAVFALLIGVACGSSTPVLEHCSGCDCTQGIGGHRYELDCPPAPAFCVCTVDGMSRQLTQVTVCEDANAPAELTNIWTGQCGFPSP